ncbi:MAG: DUF502 domain-containing protein [Deltaproteobacteria bacterium]|nr:DUF502 domain-containing protein [Deltaproteobacteria bacterium]
MIKRIKHHIRTYFLTGLLVVVPVGISLWFLQAIIHWTDQKLVLLPAKLHPNTYLPFPIPGLGLILTVIFVFLIGVIATNIIGKTFVQLGEKIVDKIPLVRSIYLLVKQVMETILSKDQESFKKVVLIEYPRKGLYSIAFVTGVAKGEIQDRTSKKVINVFVPTTPNPTSGFLIMVPEEDAITLEMDVEMAFKLVISGGMVATEKEVKKKMEALSADVQ